MKLPGRREALFAALYFCEGAPIGFLWWALPAYWAAADVPVECVTAITAAAVLPWSLKWLWAPLIDATSARVGYHRWIVVMQVLMGLTLWPLLWFDPLAQFPWLVTTLVVHAVAAATQDVSIDGLCMAIVGHQERGEVNGWMQAGMLTGRALFGGGALLLMASLTLLAGVAALVALLWTTALVLVFLFRKGALTSGPRQQVAGARRQSVFAPLRSRLVWLAALFALLGGAAFETVGALLGPFLEQANYSLAQIGLVQVGPLAAAMAAGALAGGRVADRFGHRRVAWFSLLALVLLNLALAGVELAAGLPGFVRLALLVAVYAVIGVFTASSYALFMDLAQGRWQATVFSGLMGVTNACEAGSTLAAGWIVGALGYPQAFSMMTLPSLAGLLILPLLNRSKEPAPAVSDTSRKQRGNLH